MLNKYKSFIMVMLGFIIPGAGVAAVGQNLPDADAQMEQMSAQAVAQYNPDGSLFQQITDLEQEKVLMQLEKERAQLDLELDRLAAEKIKLHMEIDTLSGRAEQQQQELETTRARLEAEAARLEKEKEALENRAAVPVSTYSSSLHSAAQSESKQNTNFSENYRLVNVVGAGGQLQATIEDRNSGQNKRLVVGRSLDGYTVKSISLDDGVTFINQDGDVQNLNISSTR